MKTLLLPTTVGVNQNISMKDALSILQSYEVAYQVVGDIVNGMYVADNGDIVAEELLPIACTIEADELARMFTQECILESNDTSARLVAQNGDIWADFNQKVEYSAYDEIQAIHLQEKMAKHFGGASRVGNFVWAWGDNQSVKNFVV